MGRHIDIATTLTVPLNWDRRLTPEIVRQNVAVFEDSGVIDQIQTFDQLTSWWPKALWTPDTTPLADEIPDCDSFAAGIVLASWVAAASSKLGILMTTDSVRSAPAELTQTLLTLGAANNGKTVMMLGGGEIKQLTPFGYKAGGLDRMEDIFQIYRALTGTDQPLSFEGHHWKLDQAWLGHPGQNIPQLWGLGAGPRFTRIMAKYADGWSTAIPAAFYDPEMYAEEVKRIKGLVEAEGRDPEKFGFGIWLLNVMHDDPEEVRKAVANPLQKFTAGIGGRFDQEAWRKDGIEPIFSKDYHYAKNLLPARMSRADAEAITDRVPYKMSELHMIAGNPEKIADTALQYIEAGATQVTLMNYIESLLPCRMPSAPRSSQLKRPA